MARRLLGEGCENVSWNAREDTWTIVRKLEKALLEGKAGSLTDNIRRLFKIHESQWELEDLCRDPKARLSTLGSLKHEIDRSNTQRVGVVRTVDALLDSRIVEPNSQTDLVCWPLTLGQALDQLVIAVVRCERAEADSAMLCELRDHQIAAVEDLFGLLLEGRLVLPPASTVKHYQRSLSTGPDAPTKAGHDAAEIAADRQGGHRGSPQVAG